MSPIDDTLRKVQGMAKQHDAATAAATAQKPGLAHAMNLSYAPTSRVLDLVTGQQGTVIDGRRDNVVIPPARHAGA